MFFFQQLIVGTYLREYGASIVLVFNFLFSNFLKTKIVVLKLRANVNGELIKLYDQFFGLYCSGMKVVL